MPVFRAVLRRAVLSQSSGSVTVPSAGKTHAPTASQGSYGARTLDEERSRPSARVSRSRETTATTLRLLCPTPSPHRFCAERGVPQGVVVPRLVMTGCAALALTWLLPPKRDRMQHLCQIRRGRRRITYPSRKSQQRLDPMDAMSDSIGEPVAALDFLGSYRNPHQEEKQ